MLINLLEHRINVSIGKYINRIRLAEWDEIVVTKGFAVWALPVFIRGPSGAADCLIENLGPYGRAIIYISIILFRLPNRHGAQMAAINHRTFSSQMYDKPITCAINAVNHARLKKILWEERTREVFTELELTPWRLLIRSLLWLIV